MVDLPDVETLPQALEVAERGSARADVGRSVGEELVEELVVGDARELVPLRILVKGE